MAGFGSDGTTSSLESGSLILVFLVVSKRVFLAYLFYLVDSFFETTYVLITYLCLYDISSPDIANACAIASIKYIYLYSLVAYVYRV